MMDPGQLKTRLMLQQPVETPDDQGGVVRTWTTFAIYSSAAMDNCTASAARSTIAGDQTGTGVSGWTASNGVTAPMRYTYNYTTSNMTLVTSAQIADATVSNGRVLLEFDDAAAPTLNTDLTVEVTCDGGSHWSAASLSSVTVNGQAGRAVAETVDQACTGGTSFAARIKTFNKNVPIYGASLVVH